MYGHRFVILKFTPTDDNAYLYRMKVHFIGCEGVSMKRLRELTEREGHRTSGSDCATTGHSAAFVAGADMVVYSAAVKPDNPELIEAKRLGLPIVERAEYLAAIASGYWRTIAVSGTHGKTTATGMLAVALADRYPTIHIGGTPKEAARREKRDYFVTEACEYRRSFLALRPDVGVILNAELDHTDCYKDKAEVLTAFSAFSENSRFTLYDGDDPELEAAVKGSRASFGFGENCCFRAVNYSEDENGYPSFFVSASGLILGKIELNVRGRHNALDALAAAAVALSEGEPLSAIASRLKNFTGVKRRMERVGSAMNAEVYTDYAHHPTEIVAALAAAPPHAGRLFVVFEPHTYSRTRDLMEGFATAFGAADELILAPVFASRETGDDEAIRTLYERAKAHVPARYFPCYDEINRYLKSTLTRGDLVIYMGAGTINRAAEALVRDCAD